MSDLDNIPPPYLDPEDQAFVNEFAASGQPPIQDLGVQEFRKLFDELQQHTPIAGVLVTEIKVPFRTKDAVKTFIFRADNAVGDLPVIFWLHGGGWVSGKFVMAITTYLLHTY
jgi:acetyl esterase